MPHIGPTELIIILLIVVLLFGGRKIPEIAKGLGKGIRDFKSALNTDSKDTTDEAKPLGTPENPDGKTSSKS
jgi:sec-independent protein translocase protein TatA